MTTSSRRSGSYAEVRGGVFRGQAAHTVSGLASITILTIKLAVILTAGRISRLAVRYSDMTFWFSPSFSAVLMYSVRSRYTNSGGLEKRVCSWMCALPVGRQVNVDLGGIGITIICMLVSISLKCGVDSG